MPETDSVALVLLSFFFKVCDGLFHDFFRWSLHLNRVSFTSSESTVENWSFVSFSGFDAVRMSFLRHYKVGDVVVPFDDYS